MSSQNNAQTSVTVYYKFQYQRQMFHLLQSTRGKYLPISEAGSGKSGVVWYALPASLLENYPSADQTPDLTSEVCCVKLYWPRASPNNVLLGDFTEEDPCDDHIAYISRLYEVMLEKTYNPVYIESAELEITALKALQKKIDTHPHLVKCFLKYIDSCIEEPVSFRSPEYYLHRLSWLSMSTVGGYQLCNLLTWARKLTCPLPQPLVYHIFVQLMEALECLHSEDPDGRMSKTDIQSINIMVSTSTSSTVSDFPNFAFIDFGGSKTKIDEQYTVLDRTALYSEIYHLASLLHVCDIRKVTHASFEPSRLQLDICGAHDADWVEFVHALRANMQRQVRIGMIMDEYDASDGDLRKGGRLFRMADRKRKMATKVEKKIFHALVKHAVGEWGAKATTFPEVEEVREVVEKYFKQKGD